MFRDILEIIGEYLKKTIMKRTFILGVIYSCMVGVLILRLYNLQILNGRKFQEDYVQLAEKIVSLPATRGNIYDRNGKLLAYNKLAYSVEIQDNGQYSSALSRNYMLYRLVKILHEQDEKIIGDLMIDMDERGEYYFTTQNDAAKRRFLRDFYGIKDVEDLDDVAGKYPSNVDANTLVEMKASTYALDKLGDEDGMHVELSRRELLDLVNIRYTMGFTNYKKYETTKVASDIKESTRTHILENTSDLLGVNITQESLRVYNESIYFSSITGYTGKVQEEQLEEMKQINPNITVNDSVGRIGIEKYLEKELHGVSGMMKIYTDNVGHIREVTSKIDPIAGKDSFLTIDYDLQKGIYHQLEQELAGILASKLSPLDEPNKENTDSTDRLIPIKDAYFQLINNNVLSLARFSAPDATPTEQAIFSKYTSYKDSLFASLRSELFSDTPLDIKDLPEDQRAYMYYMYKILSDFKIINADVLDINADYYLRWKQDSISLREMLYIGIASGWIDTTVIGGENKYSDADSIFEDLINFTLDTLSNDEEFKKLNYKYMIRGNLIGGNELCIALYDQGILSKEPEEIEKLSTQGPAYAYPFLISKISKIELTPAQLALDPCTAGAVVTDVNTGEVRALVSYPGYDANRLSNSMDVEYFNRLLNDQSLPLYNNATQTRKAPGSTFKPIAAIASLEEGVVTSQEEIDCTGKYDVISPSIKCWVYPGKHGKLNVEGALQNSCNYYFAEVGHRLGTKPSGEYSANLGTERLTKYATLFGLDHVSGVEIPENEPAISDVSPEQSTMGQGHHQYANVQLSRYVATLANRGKVFELSLIDKVVDSKGNATVDYTPALSSEIHLQDNTWQSVHTGMRRVIEFGSASRIFKDLEVNIAGKTGTAQETNSRANHAFFISYGPFEQPEISVTVNIPFGYSSSNAAMAAKDIYRLYFGYTTLDEVMNRKAINVTDVKIGD